MKGTPRSKWLSLTSLLSLTACGDPAASMGPDATLGSVNATASTLPSASAQPTLTNAGPMPIGPSLVSNSPAVTSAPVAVTSSPISVAPSSPSASVSAPPATSSVVGAGGGPAASDPEPMAPLTPPEVIDDFEDADNAVLKSEGRVGRWNAYNDGTGTQMPSAGSELVPEGPGANSTQLALHTSGSGFTDWGAGLQVDLNNSGSGAAAREPFDASAYTGVTFYAKGSGQIRVEFVTQATTEPSQGGTCAENCYDSHGSDPIALSAEWAPITLFFANLTQEGWGTPADFSPAQLLGLNFKALKGDTADATFDLWIDEVSFTKDAASSDGPDATPEPVEEVDPGPMSTPGTCKADLGGYPNNNGSVTMYSFDQGSAEVNCSFEITGRNPDTVAHVYTGDGHYFGAMNTADYNTAATCGACVEVTRDGNRKVTVTIVDQCPVGTNPKCKNGHIDLSRDAFHQIGGDNEGYLGTGNGGMTGSISWHYVPCPVSGNVQFKWKKGSDGDQYWDELLVENYPYAITSVEVDGEAATRKEYNYWEPPSGVISPSKDTYRVKVTDVNGSVVESSIPRPTEEVDGQVQFMCQ